MYSTDVYILSRPSVLMQQMMGCVAFDVMMSYLKSVTKLWKKGLMMA